MSYEFKTSGVCPKVINFDLNDGIITKVEFVGGCNGNLKALGELVKGMEATEAIKRLQGITCGVRPTSCADQFTKALQKYIKN